MEYTTDCRSFTTLSSADVIVEGLDPRTVYTLAFTDIVKSGYANLWAKAQILPQFQSAAKAVAVKLNAHRSQYEAIEAATKIPWWWVACIHERESDADFSTYLGNGEHVVGPSAMAQGRKTVLVPRGRGPFPNFAAGAIDALTHEGYVGITDWSLPRALFLAEAWNGWGYIGRINSPYIWSWSNLYSSGKFQENRHGSWFNPNLRDPQPGVVAMLKAMIAEGFIPDLAQPAIFKTPQPAPEPEPSNRELLEAIDNLTLKFKALQSLLMTMQPRTDA